MGNVQPTWLNDAVQQLDCRCGRLELLLRDGRRSGRPARSMGSEENENKPRKHCPVSTTQAPRRHKQAHPNVHVCCAHILARMVCGARFLVRGASKAGISRPSHTALAEAGTEKVQRQVPRWQNVSLPVDIGRGVGCGGLHRRRSEKRGRIGSSTSSESSAFLMQQEYVPVKSTCEGTCSRGTEHCSMVHEHGAVGDVR